MINVLVESFLVDGFNPFEKCAVLVKLAHFPNFRGENETKSYSFVFGFIQVLESF